MSHLGARPRFGGNCPLPLRKTAPVLVKFTLLKRKSSHKVRCARAHPVCSTLSQRHLKPIMIQHTTEQPVQAKSSEHEPHVFFTLENARNYVMNAHNIIWVRKAQTFIYESAYLHYVLANNLSVSAV